VHDFATRPCELEQSQFLLDHVSIQTIRRYLGRKQRIQGGVNDHMDFNHRAERAFIVRFVDDSFRINERRARCVSGSTSSGAISVDAMCQMLSF
jgi:hypothetical protein